MSVSAWSIVWQFVAVGASISFFALAAYVTLGAIRDAREMLRDLRDRGENPPSIV